MEGGAHLVDMRAVGADGLVKLVAGDAELFGPVSDVGGELGVDDLGVMRAFGSDVFVTGVRRVLFGGLFVLVFGIVMGQGASSFVMSMNR